MSIKAAAAELRTSLQNLKRTCRKVKVMRWPQRKLASLNALLQRALKDDDQVCGPRGFVVVYYLSRGSKTRIRTDLSTPARAE